MPTKKKKNIKENLFRYLTTFILTVAILFVCLFLSQLIPHRMIKNNTIKSTQEVIDLYKNEKKGIPNIVYDKAGDLRLLSIIYSENEKHPLKSLIEMNYNENCDKEILECDEMLKKEKKSDLIDYSRYWHGQTIWEKLLLIVTSYKTIIIINKTLILLLLIYASIKLWIKDKLLSIAFALTVLSTNIFFMATSMQYIPIMYIVLLSTIIEVKLIEKNSKNIDILFLILGITTCFFDFLTTETLSLTIPLLVYMYLMKKEDKLDIKKIIHYVILWLIGYAFTFLAKWIIAYIHYGSDYINNVVTHAKIRIYDEKEKIQVLNRTIRILSQLKPFDILPNGGMILLLLTFITAIYTLLFNKKNRVYYLVLLIPIMRFIVLPTHSFSFYYFTYRAYAIIIFLLIIAIRDIIKSIIGDDSYEKE